MKAAVYAGYGGPDVLQVCDVQDPVPNDDEVLLRVRAASINPLDWRMMRGTPIAFRPLYGGLRKPKTGPGRDVAGVIEAVGKNVRKLKRGDAVFGACRGACAEYACAAESRLALKPDNVTFEQAASVAVAALTALQGLRDIGHIRPGHKVLINGASGGVGTFAVQLAKSFGAEVTGVCSTRNVELVRSIGADRVVDYTTADFTKSERGYDVLLDCAVNHALSEYRRVLRPGGTCAIVGGPKKMSTIGLLKYLVVPKLMTRSEGQKFITFITRLNERDLPEMAKFLKTGKITPVIDRVYPLSEIAEAVRYVETGHARGKVVIAVSDT